MCQDLLPLWEKDSESVGGAEDGIKHVDDQPDTQTDEVGDLASQRDLPAAFQAAQLTVAQQAPEQRFCGGRLAPLRAGERQGASVGHKATIG